jgi:SAM-dependent methyltransferase
MTKQSRYNFYDAQYARFGTQLAAEIRREVYGVDLGQQGWRTLAEQDQIAELVESESETHVLDIACGSGGPSLDIAARTGCRLTGLDVEPAGIHEARGRAAALGLQDRVKFEVADCGAALPQENEAYDVVVCIDAVLHLRDRQAAFSEWFRVLRPGGRLLMTDAAVLTGNISKTEIDIRASQGEFVLVPLGFNERALEQVGFGLLERKDQTASTAEIAGKLLGARKARAIALQAEEGTEWFDHRQAFLSITETLSRTGRLSRFLYVAERPPAHRTELA